MVNIVVLFICVDKNNVSIGNKYNLNYVFRNLYNKLNKFRPKQIALIPTNSQHK